MEALEKIKAIAQDPYSYALNLKKTTDKPVVGNFCSYTPEELVFAAGGVPFRLFGTKDDISLADAHLQAYCCSLVRGGLEDALKGNLSFLDGTVFPHTCDSIQRLSDIWRLNTGFAFHIDVVLPVKLDTQSARIYMIDVLNSFKSDLESALKNRITEEKLRQAIKLYNRLRQTLGEIYEMRSKDPDSISATDLYHVIKASMITDRDEFLELLTLLRDELKKKIKDRTLNTHKRIILSGGICNHPDIYTALEESGAEVIWDDLCTGTRYFEGDIEESGDPIEAIADRYMTRVVCPAKHLTVTARGESLVRLVKDRNASGVIFMFLKFCDPHAFDYPYLKKFLDDAGIPNILLEVEEQLPSDAQLKTRFETFVDMID
ncbi:MAG: 2-hydroxyacyl-CoA dehydratase [Desulfobacteraceae bacterium]|nr:2-hydroxyacyl-CoA dehydratase [Desulfobacteraceae bacterium]MBC2754318.1 2-hydroxyacyl-CoA dehydratase [Desulfobacteraceae bacterium]